MPVLATLVCLNISQSIEVYINKSSLYIVPVCPSSPLDTALLSVCLCLRNFFLTKPHNLPGIYLLKVNNRNTRTRCEICSKLTIKIPERRHWHRSGIFIVNFEHISHLVLLFLLLTLNM